MTEIFEKLIHRSNLKRLTKSQLNTLKTFDDYNAIKNLSQRTRENQLQLISRLGYDLKKEYKDITKEDVNDWLNRNIKPYSRLTYQLNLGKFFKFLGKDTKDWFEKIENAYDKTIDPSDLWSPEEIDSLIRVYPEVQYRALVAVLFDSEARVSELCSMSIKDCEFIAGNAVVYFPESKTQRRRVELLFSTKELLPWFNLRKEQAKPEDPLWVSKCNRRKNQRLTVSGVHVILGYGTKLLGTKKHLHPHLLRHSMASYLRTKGYPDALHRKRLGLSPGSLTLERYTHVSDKQVSDGAKRAFGVKGEEPVKEEVNPLLGRNCPRCGHLNRTTNTICEKCFYSIDYENTGMEIELLEMFRTEFVKVTNIDFLFHQYRSQKQEMNLLEHFKSLLHDKTVIETEIVRQYFSNNFKLTDDQIIEFFQVLMSEQIIDIIGDEIFILGMEKLEDYIKKSKEFLKLNDKYATSK